MNPLFVDPKKEKIHEAFMRLQSSYEEYDQRPDKAHLLDLALHADALLAVIGERG